jgi:two-component system, OmpR family, phosphate regulon sensor histidine kinase PhoR
LGAGISLRALAQEAMVGSAAAALALLLLLAASQIGILMALVGWLVSLAGAGWIAHRRLRELEAIAAWIEALARDQPRPVPGEGKGLLAGRLVRPVTELGRELRRRSGRMVAQQRMLRSTIEALPDPIMLVDGELTVIRANEAARRSFDSPAPPVALARVLRDPGVLAAVGAALAGNAAGSVAFSPTHDRVKQFGSRIEPVDFGDGRRGVLMTMREQTEQVMIERMRSDFVANASHEIRTPLASIQGMIETLRGAARHDPQAREMFLAIMGDEAARMARLVDDLLSLSRVELAALQPPRELCHPSEALNFAVDRMRATAEQGGVTLAVDVPSELPAVLGDDDQLHQLFVNLIDNAIKYGGQGTAVRVEAVPLAAAPADSGPATGRPSVRISISDQGPGIAAEHPPRLTERLSRVEGARGRRPKGTGLGLAIVKHILRRHQGHLAIRSTPGAGSTFTVLLPAAPVELAAVTDSSRNSHKSSVDPGDL